MWGAGRRRLRAGKVVRKQFGSLDHGVMRTSIRAVVEQHIEGHEWPQNFCVGGA